MGFDLVVSTIFPTTDLEGDGWVDESSLYLSSNFSLSLSRMFFLASLSKNDYFHEHHKTHLNPFSTKPFLVLLHLFGLPPDTHCLWMTQSIQVLKNEWARFPPNKEGKRVKMVSGLRQSSQWQECSQIKNNDLWCSIQSRTLTKATGESKGKIVQ